MSQTLFSKFGTFWALLVMVGSFAIPAVALADDPELPIKDENYSVRYVSQSIADPIALEAGETRTITFTFKNTGAATLRGGKVSRYVSAYTLEPRYHHSIFASSKWNDKDQTPSFREDCAPGALCYLDLEVTAPENPGKYKEEFHLAARSYSWIKGGYFWLEFVVSEKVAPVAPPSTSGVEEIATGENVSSELEEGSAYKAALIGQSKNKVSVTGGEQIKLTIIYKNDGKKSWDGYKLKANSPSALAAIGGNLTFADPTWQNELLAYNSNSSVDVGKFEKPTVYLRAPVNRGVYTATVQAYVGDDVVEGSEVDIEITVTSDAPSHYRPPVFNQNTTSVTTPVWSPRYEFEPRIRVGVWKVDETRAEIQAVDDDFRVLDGDKEIGILRRGETAVFKIQGSMTRLSAPSISANSFSFYRLEPLSNPHARFKILNMERLYQGKNYDEYRGAMELVKVDNDAQRYVVNDILMEDYVAGIGENSNRAPEEYLKAQATVQRTYAFYIKEFSDKHEKRNFDVVAHTGDQLYLGYLSELQRPNFVKAAEATRGQMVTYDIDNDPSTESNIVITPYFAYTSGYTVGFHQKWGGAVKPWLVPVRAQYDAQYGRKLFGHGVGMSQLDAANRAEFLGEDWITIIKYYYTGVEVEKMYR